MIEGVKANLEEILQSVNLQSPTVYEDIEKTCFNQGINLKYPQIK